MPPNYTPEELKRAQEEIDKLGLDIEPEDFLEVGDDENDTDKYLRLDSTKD